MLYEESITVGDVTIKFDANRIITIGDIQLNINALKYIIAKAEYHSDEWEVMAKQLTNRG